MAIVMKALPCGSDGEGQVVAVRAARGMNDGEAWRNVEVPAAATISSLIIFAAFAQVLMYRLLPRSCRLCAAVTVLTLRPKCWRRPMRAAKMGMGGHAQCQSCIELASGGIKSSCAAVKVAFAGAAKWRGDKPRQNRRWPDKRVGGAHATSEARPVTCGTSGRNKGGRAPVGAEIIGVGDRPVKLSAAAADGGAEVMLAGLLSRATVLKGNNRFLQSPRMAKLQRKYFA